MTAVDGYLTVPIGSNDHQAVALNMGGSWWEINEPPPTHRGTSFVPRHLDGADTGLTFFQEWAPQDAVGAHFNIGSYGDRPFNRARDWEYSFDLLRQWPAEAGASWLGGIAFDTTGRLPAVPIPVFGYIFAPGRAWEGMIGFPGSSLTFHPAEAFGLHLEYTLLTSMRANVIVNFTEHLKLEAGTQWTNDFWYRSDRIRDSEQLMYTEKRLFSQLTWEMGQYAAFHVGGGWAFHRSFQQLDGYWGRDGPRVHLGTAPVFDLGLSLLY
jgi:hypothetical protein